MSETKKLLKKYIQQERENKKRITTVTFLMFVAFTLIGGVVAYQLIEFKDMKYTLQVIASTQKGTANLGENTVGYYDNSIQLIRVLAKDRDPIAVWKTCNHETAHYLDLRRLKLYRSKEYNQTFTNTKDFPTQYSKTNVREYFAETFMTAMQGCINLSKVPFDQRKYFKSKVLKYFPECGVR